MAKSNVAITEKLTFHVKFAQAMQHMDALSRYNPSPLTMAQLVEFGRTATEPDSFHFLKKEVPGRLANIMKEITKRDCYYRKSSRSPRTRDMERAEGKRYYERAGMQITVNFLTGGRCLPI